MRRRSGPPVKAELPVRLQRFEPSEWAHIDVVTARRFGELSEEKMMWHRRSAWVRERHAAVNMLMDDPDWAYENSVDILLQFSEAGRRFGSPDAMSEEFVRR